MPSLQPRFRSETRMFARPPLLFVAAISCVVCVLLCGDPPRVQAQRTSSGETQFFGLTGRGSRFVFVIDRSLSMEGARFAAAKREVLAALPNLKRVHQFQIIGYNEKPRGMARMAFADENGVQDAKAFLEGLTPSGGTDHTQALQAALNLGPDVIFFLTDASDPGISAKDLKKIRENNTATIHVIDISSDKAGEARSLKQLAEENRGEYKRIDSDRLSPE